jgi:hypothetical protein
MLFQVGNPAFLQSLISSIIDRLLFQALQLLGGKTTLISNDLGDEMALGESTWGELTWGQIDMGTKCVRIRSDSDSNLLAWIGFHFVSVGSVRICFFLVSHRIIRTFLQIEIVLYSAAVFNFLRYKWHQNTQWLRA